ncbi:MAG: phenylacetic acid degradation protein PaaN [Phycisphaerales bacterium]|nr:phenylacetic acid degradation protein PaaN [Phycisphaerales bacterium]
MSHEMFQRHQETLNAALEAIDSRGSWSAYPEVPSGKIYGETAKDDGLAGWKGRLGNKFEIDQPGTVEWIGAEQSPYGIDTGTLYPKADLDVLMPAAVAAMASWKRASAETRVGVCLEILHRLNKRSFEIGFSVMHTTGQGFMMAFQAGGPHAQDRGLEAVACAWREMTRCPEHATWSKRVSKTDTVTLDKTFRIIPRGVAVNIGCSTFPTWNGYPGLFASLATGNAVVTKPHPGAVLPLAITIEIAREVLVEAGFDPNVLTLACDTPDSPCTQDLVKRPEVGIIDYTGGNEFGDWIETNIRHAQVYTEKAGINTVIIDGCEDLKAMTGNLAFSLSLYSGQMCTTPQNIYIPEDGIETPDGRVSFDDTAAAIVKAMNWFLSDPARAAEVCGAIQSEATAARVAQASSGTGTVLRESASIENERFKDARTATPTVIQVDASDTSTFQQEMFGPIVYIVKTASTEESIELASTGARECGALTCAMYSRDEEVLERGIESMTDAGVAISCNLTGHIWVNQSAAFSDFHVSGANPAGNATLCDAAFVANRFRTVACRVPVPAAVEEAVS